MRVALALILMGCGGSKQPPPIAPARAAPMTLSVAVESATHYELFPAGPVTFIALGWDYAIGTRDKLDRSHELGAKLKKVANVGLILHLAGSWPDIWASTLHGPLMGPAPVVVRYRESEWQRAGMLNNFDHIKGLATFHEGVIALAERHTDPTTYELVAFDTAAKIPVLEPCFTPAHLQSRKNGDVLVYGYACTDNGGRIDRWTGAGEHTSEAFPTNPSVAVFHATDDVLFFGGYRGDPNTSQTPYFGRRDGKGWLHETPPLTREVKSMAVLADGTVLALGDARDRIELAKRTKEGAWSMVSLNAPAIVAHRFVARSEDDLWIIASDDKAPPERRNLLLHNRPLGAPSHQ